MTDRTHIPQEELALYAMQALSVEESAVVRLHLAECEVCRAELAELSGDLALLAMSVEQVPVPEGARQRFLKKISAEAQTIMAPPSVIKPRHASSFALWLPWAAVAALLIVAAWLGMKVNSLDKQLQDESDQVAQLDKDNAHAREVLEVLTAPSAQRAILLPAKTPPAPSGRAVYLAERGGLIFQANNLAHLEPDKTYELWVIPANGQNPIPAGLFQPDASGSASVVLPPLPKEVPAKAFGVTIEKAEGSPAPTLPIILSGAAPVSAN